MNQTGTKKLIFSALIGASSAVLCLYMPALLLLPAALGFLAAGWGVGCFAAGLAASLAGVLFTFWPDAASALTMAALYVPAALIVAFTLKRRGPYRTGVALSSAAVVLALYCILCLPSVLAGQDPFAAFQESMGLYLEAIRSTVGAGDTAAAGMLQTWEESLPLLVPQVSAITMLGMGIGAGFLDMLIAYKLARRANPEAIKPMAPMHVWELSREFTIGALVLLLGCVAVQWMQMKNYEAIVASLLCIVTLPFSLMGLCFLEFTRRLRGRGAGFVALYVALLAFMMPYSIVALATLGVLDRIFRFRRRVTAQVSSEAAQQKPQDTQDGDDEKK